MTPADAPATPAGWQLDLAEAPDEALRQAPPAPSRA